MFLREPDTPEAAVFLDQERAANGYVMNLERAWAWRNTPRPLRGALQPIRFCRVLDADLPDADGGPIDEILARVAEPA